MLCHHCKTELKVQGKVFRSEECPSCGYDVYCCLNCSNYDPSAHNRCREPLSEWVSDREKANFCDYFEPNRGRAAGATPPINARQSFDALFKK